MTAKSETVGVVLSERQFDVLRDIARLADRPSQCSRKLDWEGLAPEIRGVWAAPMDFGGQDGSHHSGTARWLAQKGLIDRYKNGKVNYFKSRNKSSCCYRINSAGLALLAELSKEKP